jgi:hypothetical protein
MRMPGVRGHASQPEKQGGTKGDSVNVAMKQPVLVQVFGAAELRFLVPGLMYQVIDAFRIKIDIGQGGEKRLHNQLIRPAGRILAFSRAGQAHQRSGEFILFAGYVRFFAANAYLRAAAAAGRLLALETKHIGHFFPSVYFFDAIASILLI